MSDEQVLAEFVVTRHLTTTLPGGRVIGDPLWAVEIRYEGGALTTRLEHHSLETDDAQDLVHRLEKEMHQEGSK